MATLRPQIADDLVADIATLLASDATVDRGTGPAPIQPADIAVLVRTNARGEALRDRLIIGGIPAVMHGASSIFSSAVAEDWLRLLVALEQPRQATVRQASLTCFFGWTFADLARATEADLVDLTQQIRWWSRILASRGVAALLEAATADARVPERLLATRGGERRLTDLRHLAQVLHAARTAGQLGVGALVEWLRSRMAEARGNGSDDESRRLETDAQAVTILTVHRSKGLEFPIVYLPDAWDRHVSNVDEGRILRLHEPGHERRSGLRARRRRQVRSRPVRTLRPVPRRGGRRGPSAGLCRSHPGPVPGRDLVGRLTQHAGVGAPALPAAGARRGGRAALGVPDPDGTLRDTGR